MGTEIRGPVGLIAGEGQLPLLVGRRILERGIPLFVYRAGSSPVPGIAPERVVDLLALPGAEGRFNLEAVLRDMVSRGIRSVSMAGLIPKRAIYGGVSGTAADRLLAERDNNDHALLGRVVAAFETMGFTVVPYRCFIEDSLAPSGHVAGRALSQEEEEDIRYGREILSVLLPLSFGQSLVVARRSVVAVEAMEGTDEMIRRSGDILRGSGGVLVKMMRSDQDERFDIPVVGLQTLENMRASGLTALAVEAGRTIILDSGFHRKAEEWELAVEGIERQ